MSAAIGQELRQAREERSLTIEQVAQSTHIRIHYLKAMEAGEFGGLPSMAQARGFLRTYANYLDLDPEALLAALGNTDRVSARSQPVPSTAEIPKSDSEQTEQANQIFVEIGQKLSHQRELLGLSLDDVERHTHLRQYYLQSLEAGDLDKLPSPVQGRGMLNNYATFMGMNPESLLLRFADGLQARLAARQSTQKVAKTIPARRKSGLPRTLQRFISGDILIGATLAIFLIVLVIWVSIRIFAMSTEQTTTPSAPSIADVLLASPTPSDTPTPLPPSPTIPAPPQPFPTQILATLITTGTLTINPRAGIQVYVTVNQRTWMRVTVDGNIEYEGRVLPGTAYPFIGESQVEILTGNGAALQVFYNGTDLGQMGNFGQVVDHIYSRQGLLNPTPTITPMPTATQPIPPTPRVTITPSPVEASPPAMP